VLGNLPLLKRLRTLLLANNRVASISPSIHLSVPNLTTLVLTGNSIVELGDLEPLKEIKGLKYLALLGNPVREKKWYREWLAWRIPSLRVLDFQRIRDKVRLRRSKLSAVDSSAHSHLSGAGGGKDFVPYGRRFTYCPCNNDIYHRIKAGFKSNRHS
jgi:Leucine-rich repeat (LRR) protein